ncbi:MAG: hypothetical protein D6702_03225 [Planctomycetota bacterium]|nr:MAG: hypothetical protein D6702_03225 [Planctomycetota bacterium]
MRVGRPATIALAAALLAAGAAAQANRRGEPHAAYAFPAGAAAGTTVEVWVGGQFLRGADGVRITGGGVRAEVLGHYRALNNQQRQALRRYLRERLRRPDGGTVALPSRERDGVEIPPLPGVPDLAALDREGIQTLLRRYFDPRQQPNPQLGETVVLRLSVDPEARPGMRELRLLTPAGASNPLRFEIGTLLELREREPNDREPPAEALPSPAVLNGQITPGDIDRFRFRFRSGQRVVVAARARALIPYLADAVPGWFQAVVAVYGPDGSEIAYDDDFLFHPDPALVFVAPVDGDYLIEIRDAIWRGREDFVYRLEVGELPFLEGVFPLGVPAGARSVVRTFGWNLPSDWLVLDGSAGEPGGAAELAPLAGALAPGPAVVEIDPVPAETEVEAGDDAEARELVLPALIDGRIDRPGDLDRYAFRGRAGDRIVAEILARRLGSPLDSFLQLLGPDGRVIAGNDDFEDPAAGLLTHHADSRLAAELPRRGRYVLVVGDTQGQGGELFAYRLRVGPPRPGFELRATPSALNVPAGGSLPFTIHVLRRDGFDGEIELQLEDAPEGWLLAGGRVPAGVDRIRLTLTAPPRRDRRPVPLRIVGRARVRGREVTATVQPADDRMQAFLWRFLVPARELLACVAAAGGVRTPLRPAREEPWRLPLGGEAEVRVAGPVQALPPGLSLRLDGGPDGFELGPLAVARGGLAFTIRTDRAVVPAGLAGNLIVQVWGDPAAARAARRGGQERRRPGAGRNGGGERLLGYLPAIPFRVVKP